MPTFLAQSYGSKLIKTALTITVLLIVFGGHAVYSSEAGQSTYIPGFLDTLAGFLPPPGWYFQEDFYFYNGTTGSTSNLANANKLVRGGQIETNLREHLPIQFSILTHVTKTKLMGSCYSWGLVVPFLEPELSGQIITPTGSVSRSRSVAALGEIEVVPLMLGWHNGRSNQKAWFVTYVPSGLFRSGDFAYTSLNHWAFEFDYAYTFLDKKTGREFDAAPGYTFNTPNTSTNYRSGQEFHTDLAAIQHFSDRLGIGAVGYVFIQTTGDSGSGAKLGALQGRTYALGPIVTYNLKVGSTPVGLTGKYYSEFDVSHRFTGHSWWLNVNASF